MFEFFDWIIDLFTSLIDFIGSIGQFAVNFLAGIFDLISLIPRAIDIVTTVISSLPTFVVVFAYASIYVLVILRLIGRGSVD